MVDQTSKTDTEWMIQFTQGDDSAFTQLMEQNFSRVISTIQRFVHNQQDAEDLAQEVFLRVYNAREKYTPDASFHTWLYRIITNLCLNYIRDQKRKKARPLRDKNSSSPEMSLKDSTQETPSRMLSRQEICNEVKEALISLPENQRMAVILAKYENLSYEEIAHIMKTSVQAVKSLLNRAKMNLKEELLKKIRSKSDLLYFMQ
ncbi:MAG: sigma-70 family RNA polymerase sigma factor [Candidatus Brocadiae bacterium]|nr:sigma-70 family RNA polymerase sigma factor [Candidatus Brocadiia bacterium]